MTKGNGIYFDSILVKKFSRAFVAILIWGVAYCGLPCRAQTVAANLPVLNAQTDINGVDMNFGTYTTGSPFVVEAPGAGNLKFQANFNGRRMSFNLNIYLADETYMNIGADQNNRDVSIHLGGQDALFQCAGLGQCTQARDVDGSRLSRSSGDMYVLTTRNGTVYTFFAPRYEYLLPCNDPDGDPECNAAGYAAYAFVSTIVYPNGEKLTFASWQYGTNPRPGIQTVTSNLGYRLDITPDASVDRPIQEGAHWLRYVSGAPAANVTLYKGDVAIQSVSTSITYSGQFNRNLSVVQHDALGRTFQMNSYAYSRATCPGAGADLSIFTPTFVQSPGGVQTSISYYQETSPALYRYPLDNYFPVKSVSRGGQTWGYDWVRAGVDFNSATDPVGAVQAFRSAGEGSPFWYRQGTGCTIPVTGGKIYEHKDGLARTRAFEYDGTGQVSKAVLPESNGFTYNHDGRGNLISIVEAAKPGSSALSRVIYQAGYDTTCTVPVKCNKPNWVKDANQNQTDYTYDTVHGGVSTETLPPDQNGVRPQTRYTYAPYDTGDGILYRLTEVSSCTASASCAGGAGEVRTITTYWNATFLPDTETRRTGLPDTQASMTDDGELIATKVFGYDIAGRRTQITDAGGHVAYKRYDAVGRLTGDISPDPGTGVRVAKRFTYNGDNQPVTEDEGTVSGTDDTAWAAFSAFRTTTHSYNSAGLREKTVVSANGVTQAIMQFSYNGRGQPECTAIRMNPAMFGAQLPGACALGTEGSQGPDRITRNRYDAAGQLVQVRKAVGTPLEQAYATYNFTPNGKQKFVVDANGNRAQLTYDRFDRQVGWYFPSTVKPTAFDWTNESTVLASAGAVSTTDYESYEYDANGNRTSLRKRDGRTFSYAYDPLNRVVSKIVPDACVLGYACTNVAPTATRDVYYSYDLRGLQTAARFDAASGSDAIFNEYDGFGRMTRSTTSMGGVARALRYKYDLDGNRTRVIHPDDTAFSYEYDGLERSVRVRENGGTIVATMSWDAQGRRSGEGRGTVGATYGYDALSRPTSIADDLAGAANDVTTTLGYNSANQIASRSLSNVAYAFNGYTNVNRAYAVNGLNQYDSAGGVNFGYDANGNLTASGTTAYSYDAENRLVLSSTGAGLAYDPLGRLFETSFGSGGVTRFLYDGDQLTAEYDGSGTLLRRYVHGPGEDDPMLWYEGAGLTDRRSLQVDHQGTVVSVADAAGNAIELNKFDEYGIPAGTNIGRFQYTGQAWIPELGMYHYKARIYSPTLGRFLQTDPIGYEDQINLYAYVANDPVNGRDPSGLEIVVNGSKDDRKEFAKLVYQSTGVRVRIGKDGVLSESGKRNAKVGSADTARALGAAISAKGTVSFNLVRDDAATFGDTFATNTFDLGDFAKFSAKSDKFAGALFHHVVTERTAALSNGGSFRSSHQAALSDESKVMGAANRDNSGSSIDSRLQNGNVRFNYTGPTGNLISSFSIDVVNGVVDP